MPSTRQEPQKTPKATKESNINTLTPHVEPEYEFAAPQFHDFTHLEDASAATPGGSRVSDWFRTGAALVITHCVERQQTTPKESDGLDSMTPTPTRRSARILSLAPLTNTKPTQPSKLIQSVTAAQLTFHPGTKGTNQGKRQKTTTQRRISALAKSKKITAPTSEDMALQKAQQERHQAAKRQKQTHDALVRLKAGPSYAPVRSVKPLTVPQEFHFETSRLHNMTLRSGTIAATVKSTTTKPAAKSSASKSAPKLTVPQPFQLQTSVRHHKASSSSLSSTFVPLAVQVKTFETKTPDRFKKKPTPVQKVIKTSLTLPKSPQLLTKVRSKPVQYEDIVRLSEMFIFSIKSTEELELESLAKEAPFKAKPVDPKVLHSAGDLGVPKIKKPEPTQPIEPHLSTSERAEKRKAHHLEEEPIHEPVIKATELRKEVLERVIGVPPRQELPLTVPMSPAITKPAPKPIAEPEPEPVVIKAHPVPDFSHPFQPKIAHREIQPDPIQLPGEALSAQHRAELAKRLEAEAAEAERLRHFRAQPVPDLNAVPSSVVSHPPRITQPHPFHLVTEERAALHAEHNNEENEPPSVQFHARPVPADVPFVPKKSTKPLTEQVAIQLATEQRSHEREVFEQHLKEREEEEEHLRQEQERQAKAEEEERLKQLRQETVVKAQPIRRFKSVSVHPSDKPLTEPQSPAIGAKRRRQPQL